MPLVKPDDRFAFRFVPDPFAMPLVFPRMFHSRVLFTLLALILMLGAASGCSRKAAPRSVTPEERTAFVERKLTEGSWALGLRPQRGDQAREAALDVLAIAPDETRASILLSDAEFSELNYLASLKALRPLEKRGVGGEELLYRQARGLYWYHSWWKSRNYAKAREKAQACLAVGDKYLIECYDIVRNSYLGEVKGQDAKRAAAYQQAATSAAELLAKLPADHGYRGDLQLLLAEYYLDHLNQPARGEEYLAQVRELAKTRPALAERVVNYERERELRAILASAKK